MVKSRDPLQTTHTRRQDTHAHQLSYHSQVVGRRRRVASGAYRVPVSTRAVNAHFIGFEWQRSGIDVHMVLFRKVADKKCGL